MEIVATHTQIRSITATGGDGIIVDIECHLSNNLPNIVIVGYANKAVDEARERIRGAFATSRIMLPRKRIIINLAPADVPKADSGFDLAIAVAILVAGGEVATHIPSSAAFIGELGLDGSTRAVRGIIGKILVGRAHGLSTFYIPVANLAQAQLVPDVTLIPVNNLAELHCHLNATFTIPSITTVDGIDVAQYFSDVDGRVDFTDLSDIVDQPAAKRALVVAAAGGHNIMLTGPPGAGKSLLAKAMPGIMPPLSREETLEVTHLHSLASHNYEQIVTQRPFRAPHHSASSVAVTGGGAIVKPGEISLAHRGVLFFDEIPEFSRPVLESLRQPLEDRIISVTRNAGSVDYPANFILVATANPCPCGYYGSNDCRCATPQIVAYEMRLSGPIRDRIDIHCPVGEIDHRKLLATPVISDSETSATVRQKIVKARQFQATRLGSDRLNTDMTNHEVKTLTQLESAAIDHLNAVAHNYGLSARAYMRSIKVARTIADLAGSPTITRDHVKEALSYRPQSRKREP